VTFLAEMNPLAVIVSHKEFRATIPEDSTAFLINASSSLASMLGVMLTTVGKTAAWIKFDQRRFPDINTRSGLHTEYSVPGMTSASFCIYR
jgi:hypothetical protein